MRNGPESNVAAWFRHFANRNLCCHHAVALHHFQVLLKIIASKVLPCLSRVGGIKLTNWKQRKSSNGWKTGWMLVVACAPKRQRPQRLHHLLLLRKPPHRRWSFVLGQDRNRSSWIISLTAAGRLCHCRCLLNRGGVARASDCLTTYLSFYRDCRKILMFCVLGMIMWKERDIDWVHNTKRKHNTTYFYISFRFIALTKISSSAPLPREVSRCSPTHGCTWNRIKRLSICCVLSSLAGS